MPTIFGNDGVHLDGLPDTIRVYTPHYGELGEPLARHADADGYVTVQLDGELEEAPDDILEDIAGGEGLRAATAANVLVRRAVRRRYGWE